MEEELIPFTKSLLKGATNLFSGKKGKYIIAGLGAAGFASARPFKGAYGKIVNEGILGSPSGTQDAAAAALGNPDMEYEVNNSPGPMGNRAGSAGPNGDIVFGLHNLRA